MSRVQSVGEAEARDAAIRRMLREGSLSGREIARRVGCSHGHVDKLRRDLTDEPETDQLDRFSPTVTRPLRLPPHGGPFARLEAAEAERDRLFVRVQELAARVAELEAAR